MSVNVASPPVQRMRGEAKVRWADAPLQSTQPNKNNFKKEPLADQETQHLPPPPGVVLLKKINFH